ncbi:uncharacterized protein TNCV_4514171 [Trichonephila clavipes]|nr:uncharacterized protein TNCV_4514171 [Trichonephila clavipes]
MDREPTEVHAEEIDLATSYTQDIEPMDWENSSEVKAPPPPKKYTQTLPALKMIIAHEKHNVYYASLQENVVPSALKKGSPPPSPEVVRRKIRSRPKVVTYCRNRIETTLYESKYMVANAARAITFFGAGDVVCTRKADFKLRGRFAFSGTGVVVCTCKGGSILISIMSLTLGGSGAFTSGVLPVRGLDVLGVAGRQVYFFSVHLGYLCTTEKMPCRRVPAHYEQFSEFERGCLIGLKEGCRANRRIARLMGRSDAAIRRCWQERVDSGRIQRHDGIGRPRATVDQEDRLIVRSSISA